MCWRCYEAANVRRRVVTPDQLAEGYVEFRGDYMGRTVTVRRRYEVVRELPDGNTEVIDPASVPKHYPRGLG